MFLDQNSGRESFERVVVEDRDCGLEENWAAVEIFIDEVDGAAGDLYPVCEGLVLGVEAGESGQQGRVNVEDAIGELRNELSTQEAHIACETNPIDPVLLK